ncbi:MAG: hypothetical protein SGPRY_009532, partial [Prymnesium sp.]
MSADLAVAAYEVGATYIIENPVDRGWVGSPHFSWKARGHVPLWLMPQIRQLREDTRPVWSSFAQCAFRGEFQKWTTLMASGPQASRLRAVNNIGCAHTSHTRVARGRDLSGSSEAEAAGEYPILMRRFNCVKFSSQRRINAEAAAEFLKEGLREISGGEEGDTPTSEHSAAAEWEPRALLETKETTEWKSVPRDMPDHWAEREDVLGGHGDEARAAAIRYVSRRLAEPGSEETLAREALPSPCLPPRLRRRRCSDGRSGPKEPLSALCALNSCFVACTAADMAMAEREMKRGDGMTVLPRRESVVFIERDQPEWASRCVWDTRDSSDCVPLQPYDEDDLPVQEAKPEFFKEWGAKLEWPDEDMLYRVRMVPMRLVPKNVVRQTKWKINDADELYEAVKWRVAADDSITLEGGDSRNSGIDKSDLSNVSLPTIAKLARAMAIVRPQSKALGLCVPARLLERVAVWALDLSDAYRRLATARHEWWQQGFVWFDGVRLDTRCVFGSAHLVDLFQRVSSFVLAVAAVRVKKYEQECAGSAAGVPPVRLETEVSADGDDIRLYAHVEKSRPEAHLAIVCRTFVDAGWDVAIEKVQLGWQLNLLGLALTTRGDGAMTVPEVKRRGMLIDIQAQQRPAAHHGTVSREEVKKLTGRTSFIAQVAAEGNAYLQPLFRMRHAPAFHTRVIKGARGEDKRERVRVRCKLRRLKVAGRGELQEAYQEALAWWHAALEDGISVPLAPRSIFPSPAVRGCLYVFTDAPRESTGYGGFTTVRWGTHERRFVYLAEEWDEATLRKLQADEISMPAGEAYGAVMLIDAAIRLLSKVSHVICFTDSDATAKALATANSGAPQLNYLVRCWL